MGEEKDLLELLDEIGMGIETSIFEAYDGTSTYVRITEDNSQAWLYLAKKEDGSAYSKEEIYELLEKNDVRAGYNNSNIAAMAKKKVYEREIKVAESVLPIPGENGYYEYTVDVDNTVKMPEIREDGSVDYQSMSVLNNVNVGDLVARYHHATEGKPGVNVRGEEIPVAPVKELPPLKGKGIKVSDTDPDVYEAEKDGKIEFKDGRINIISVHQVMGDVDLITGKIEFFGDVVVSGNVEAGVIIRAGKSITIEGTVEAATLYAGEDIVLKRGIQGNQKGKVVAKGNIYADFIEHTEVQSGKSIHANSILNSTVRAGEKVILTGKKGCIIGGFVHGDLGIDCKELGNISEVKTVVHAGCEQEIWDKYREISKQKAHIKEMAAQIAPELKHLSAIMAKGGVLPKSLKDKFELLKKQKEELIIKIEDIKEAETRYNAQIERTQNATVRIDGNLYKGSIIAIGNCQLIVPNNTCYMEYRNISGMIAGKVIAKF
ncbi:MAG: DUF342 domain-containing protein [Lachnospiraceae bacterium]|nr:DUF342 domain-containing protein [Lachnospiraceae bacterium]